MIVRRVFTDVAPQNNLAGLLVHIQRLHHHHDVFYIIRKLLDGKLVIINKLVSITRDDMKLETIYINVKWTVSAALSIIHRAFDKRSRLMCYGRRVIWIDL